MDIIVYVFMFVIGVLLGSFYTLAVHRIPLKQDITHTRSYCPKCNHKLNFLDLIPILSYIFLGGKCRYCKNRIRPRYIIIEIISGIIFLCFAIAVNVDLLNIEYTKIATLIFGIMFFSTVFIIIGILKEYKKIQVSVFNFGIITTIVYMIYLYVLRNNIYRYIIYIALLSIIAILNNKKSTQEITRKIMFAIYMSINIAEIFMLMLG